MHVTRSVVHLALPFAGRYRKSKNQKRHADCRLCDVCVCVSECVVSTEAFPISIEYALMICICEILRIVCVCVCLSVFMRNVVCICVCYKYIISTMMLLTHRSQCVHCGICFIALQCVFDHVRQHYILCRTTLVFCFAPFAAVHLYWSQCLRVSLRDHKIMSFRMIFRTQKKNRHQFCSHLCW